MKLALILLFFACSVQAQIASGGPFSLSQSAVAGGGRASANGSFAVEGTAAQSAVGGPIQAGPFKLHGGFWTPAPFAPTAAQVGIAGRALTASGNGIRGAYVTLTGGDGIERTTVTGSFGYYSFSDVLVGDTYVLTVSTGRYIFPEPTIIVHIVEMVENLDFIAAP